VGTIHVQIVEGNPHLRSLLGWHLQQGGYTVHLTSGVRQAREVYYRQQPDLIVVDSDLSMAPSAAPTAGSHAFGLGQRTRCSELSQSRG
jgi:two-component system, OmpR family, response regulator